MRKTSTIDLSTPAKRAKLPASKNPYWVPIAGQRGGLTLGWRRSARRGRPGTWIAKLVAAGERYEGKIGNADDQASDRTLKDCMSFTEATAAVIAWAFDRRNSDNVTIKTGPTLTVRSAVEHYITHHRAAEARWDAKAASCLHRHVLRDEAFSSVALADLTAEIVEAWRARLSPALAKSTVNRILNTIRAVLNAAAERHRRMLPPHIEKEISIGLRSLTLDDDEAARPMQILSEAQVAEVIDAAYAVDEDFGRLIVVMSACGCRFIQASRMKVGDLQATRLMVPAARKGAAKRRKAAVAIQLSVAVRARLEPCVAGRAGSDEPLLMRWHLVRNGRNGPNHIGWGRSHRVAWQDACEIGKKWSAVVAALGLPDGTVPYCLRHTSIVRRLKAGLPATMVAQMHDTSVSMLEKTYARFITDASAELAKLGMLDLAA